jgi:DNA cross-link repair 1A protein
MPSTKVAAKPLTPKANSKSNVPVIGRQSNKKVAYSKGNQNASILSFFSKVDPPNKDASSLFLSYGREELDDRPRVERSPTPVHVPLTDAEKLFDDPDETPDRFNESTGSVKRRRISNGLEDTLQIASGRTSGPSTPANGLPITPDSQTPLTETNGKAKSKPKQVGGFVVESDDEESEDESRIALIDEARKEVEEKQSNESAVSVANMEARIGEDQGIEDEAIQQPTATHIKPEPDTIDVTISPLLPRMPAQLKKEATSIDDFGGFDDPEDFPEDDEFTGGEEFMERRWMEEQAALEAAENGIDVDDLADGCDPNLSKQAIHDGAAIASCPICDTKLPGLNDEQVSQHVNACLDGNPLPPPVQPKAGATETKMMPPNAATRFSRAAVPRPGQANPFDLGNPDSKGGSAFSKLMSSHAEDAAWANAAAAEQSSRGKPAYQRTCPFYKIMPGFFICVDAFRYGAVQGCNAYFLSHFHSDHYIGLTSSWCHGPIYCSKVTANLVQQQLRVDPKWVVALEFENKVEIPGTQGVTCNMIPANHCPGSSLFLFEKVVGKGDRPKMRRVLHCGDFRACPAHIAHPLLMPDIVDSITGKTRQQKIDVCYLDTTYLNPRYAFPPQEDVIKACADMCVSLKKERAEESDAWEVVKKERAGAGMAKFVGTAAVKTEDSIAMEIGSKKPRGRLLVICGTYSIGKERICMGIARALNCKIWAPPGKQRICAALEDPELLERLTDDPREAQIHMQMLMEIRAETLQDYLNGFKPHFSRIVGFRPSGWNYRPPNSRFVESPAVQTVLMSDNWRSRYSMAELVPQRGSTREASCFGVPYSEHSSFRELTMFCCALRIEKVVPTVNVGSAAMRAKMKAWIDRWQGERRKAKDGVIRIGDGEGEVKW